MDYFILSQDMTIPNYVEPVGILKVIDPDMIKEENIHKMDGLAVQFEIKENSSHEFVDFIEHPVHLVSDKLKAILEKYDDNAFFKPIFLADIKKELQKVYWFMVPKEQDCLSPKSEFKNNGSINRLVIDMGKVGYRKIFRIKGIAENIVIIRLDVAESLLRRNFEGIKLSRIETDFS